MHDTAKLTGSAFLKTHGFSGCRILDVGSMDVNGTLREFAPDVSTYIGVDIEAGSGVDTVLTSPHKLPFPNENFDLVISTSCLEHDEFFWLTFGEMARVTRSGGFLYVSAPSNGPIHHHPVDCWRFYPDAAKALGHWAFVANGTQLRLVESFLMPPQRDIWTDFVAIYGREPIHGIPKLIAPFIR